MTELLHDRLEGWIMFLPRPSLRNVELSCRLLSTSDLILIAQINQW